MDFFQMSGFFLASLLLCLYYFSIDRPGGNTRIRASIFLGAFGLLSWCPNGKKEMGHPCLLHQEYGEHRWVWR